MNCLAVVLQEPKTLTLDCLQISEPRAEDVVVDVKWSGISTGTERLLWSGQMPNFPGMGYPLVPGYESVGTVVHAGAASGHREGELVFVPGSRCFGEVKGLFGGAASRLVADGSRAVRIDDQLGEQAILIALAATAYHAIAAGGGTPDARRSGPVAAPDLIVGHGVLGRMLARLTVAAGAAPPTVWEVNVDRQQGALGYPVIHPDADSRRNYKAIYDVSGDSSLLDTLIGRLAPEGEIVLAGFYSAPISFQFAPAFMREAHIRVAAQWQPADLLATRQIIESGLLSLDGLITNRSAATDAASAYTTAFSDPSCLKMVLDWRHCS